MVFLFFTKVSFFGPQGDVAIQIFCLKTGRISTVDSALEMMYGVS
jgi:hypothetical protein